MRQCFYRGQIINRHHFDIPGAIFQKRAHHATANAAKSIDCDFEGHMEAPFRG
jgi:hypothetical protein